MIAKIFEEGSNMLKKLHERELAKKRPHVNGTKLVHIGILLKKANTPIKTRLSLKL